MNRADNEKKKLSKSKLIAIILPTLAALIMVIFSLGHSLLPLFSNNLQYNEPQYACFDKNNNIKALTDDNLIRFSTFDQNQQTDFTKSLMFLSNQDDKYYNVISDDEYCFVLHTQHDIDSGYICLEEILSINNSTKNRGCLFRQEYSPLVDKLRNPSIKDIQIKDNEFYITKTSPQNNRKIELLKIQNYSEIASTDKVATYYSSTSNNDNNTENNNKNIIQTQPTVVKSIDLPYPDNSILFAQYNPVCQIVVFSTILGEIYQIDSNNKLECIHPVNPDISFNNVCIDDTGKIYATNDFTNTVYKISKNNHQRLDISVYANHIDVYNNNLVVSDRLTNSIIMYNPDTLEVISSTNCLPYNISLLSYSILSSISFVYIICFLIVIIVKGLIYFFKNAKSWHKKIFFLIVGGLILNLSISGLFVYSTYSQIKDVRQQSLETFSLLLSKTNVDLLNNIYDSNYLGNKSADVDVYVSTLEDYYYAHASGNNPTAKIDLSTKDEINNYLKKEGINSEDFKNIQSNSLDKFYELFISEAEKINLTIQDVQENKNGQLEIISGEFDDEMGTKIFAASPIYTSSNEVIGFVSLSSAIRQIIVQQAQIGLYLFLSLVVVMCALTFILLEIFAQLRAYRKAKLIKKGRSEGKTQIFSSRTLFFFATIITSVDLTFCVLVVQDILAAKNIENPGVLLGLPTSLMFAGLLLGTWIGMRLLPKKSARNIMTVFSGILILVFIVAVVAVINNYYWMFCISKIIIGCCCGAINLINENIQFQASNKKTQALIVNESSLGALSAGAIAGMVAGFIAQYIGNYAIYIICILASVVILAASLYYLPKKVYFDAKATNKTVSNNKDDKAELLEDAKKIENKHSKMIDKKLIKFTLSPMMISVLLLLVFVSIFGYQYFSIIFPLFAQDVGLDKSQIGIISMIMTCLVFAFNSVFKKYFMKLSQRIIAFFSLIITGFALSCFGINSTVFWIITSLFLVLFGYRIATISYKLVWTAYADYKKVNKSKVSFLVIVAREFSKLVTPLIITSLLWLGLVEICVIIGIICCVSAFLFWFLTKKYSKINDKVQ